MLKPVIYSVGGTVQASGGIYISRQADEELLQLCRDGVFAYVLTSRQVGKSSLMVQTSNQLREASIHTLIIDLNAIGSPETADQWYLTQLAKICDHFDLELEVGAWWRGQPDLAVADRLIRFYKNVLLARISGRIVIFVDEIDETIKLPYASDFYAAIRSLYNARASEPELRRLSFVLIGSATPSDLIKDPKRTPFNIGRRVDLADFTFEEAKPLAAGFYVPAEAALQVLKWITKWTGGHPYLTQRLCGAIAEYKRADWRETDVDEVVTRTFFGKEGEKDTNLDFVRSMLSERAPDRLAVLNAYREVLSHPLRVRDEEQSQIISHLKLSGVVRSEDRRLRVRNAIYEKVFHRRWIREHLPIKWWQNVPNYVWYGAAAILVLSIVAGVFLKRSLMLEAEQVSLAKKSIDEERLRIEQKAYQDSVLQDLRAKADDDRKKFNISLRARVFAADVVKRSESYPAELLNDADALLACQAYLFNKSIAGLKLSSDVYQALSAVLNAPYFSAVVGRHAPGFSAVAFSNNNQKLAAAGEDGTVFIWDVESRKPNPISAKLHSGAAVALAFSASGDILASGGRQDGRVKLWAWKKKREIALPEQVTGLRSLAWSSRKALLATAGSEGRLRVWDVSQVKPIVVQEFKHGSSINAVAFSGDGKVVASAGADGKVKAWDLQKNKSEPKFSVNHASEINALSFSRNVALFATGGMDAGVRIWNADKPRDSPDQYSATDGLRVLAVALAANGTKVATGNSDGLIRIFNRGSGTVAAELRGHNRSAAKERSVKSLAFSSDGKYLASGSLEGSVRLWEMAISRELQPILNHENNVYAVAVDPQGNRFAAGGEDKEVLLTEIRGAALATQALPGQKSRVRCLAFSPNGVYLASGSDEDLKARVWNMGKLKDDPIVLKDRADMIYALAFRADSKLLATGDAKGRIQFWEGEKFKHNAKMALQHEGSNGVRSLAFSPNGKWLVSAGGEGSIRLWDCRQIPFAQKSESKITGVGAIAFSPDGTKLVSGDDVGKIQLWNFPELKVVKVIAPGDALIKAVAFNTNGKMLAAARADGLIQLWDFERADDPIFLKGHTAKVWSIAFSADGETLISGSEDKTVRLWMTRLDRMAGKVAQKLWRNLEPGEWDAAIGKEIEYVKTWDEILSENKASSSKKSPPAQNKLTSRSTP